MSRFSRRGWGRELGQAVRVVSCCGAAVLWVEQAAENGYAEAQFTLGMMYGAGDGVEQDVDLAMAWIVRAADQGNAEAISLLQQQ